MKFTVFPEGRFEALVQRVAERVTARCPPVVANNPERAVSEERIEEILDDCIAWALQFPQENRIGFIGRARLKSALPVGAARNRIREKFAELAAEKLIAPDGPPTESGGCSGHEPRNLALVDLVDLLPSRNCCA